MGYLTERGRVLELVEEAGAMLRAEAERPEGPRGAGSQAAIDDEICAFLVECLVEAFPKDTVRSEELPERPGRSGRAFLVDPHDGTRHFLKGSRDTSISVGLVEEGRLLMGVVYAPLASDLTGPEGLLVDWAEGEPLRRNGHPVIPSPNPPQGIDYDGVVLASPNMHPGVREWNTTLLAPARLVGCGSVATRAALVALGDALAWLTVRNPLGSWDYAAGQAFHQASGGALVGEDGQPITWEGTSPTAQNRDFFGARSLPVAQELARRYREAFGELGWT